MGKVEKFDLVSELMLWYHEGCSLGEKLPQGSTWNCLLFWDEFKDLPDMVDRFLACIKERCGLDGKNIYLCMVGGHGGTPRIKKYYKLWKLVGKEYPLDGFVLGNEYEICLDCDTAYCRTAYCGIAKVSREALGIAVRIAFDLPTISYIYITNEELEIYNGQVKKYFQDTMACGRGSYNSKYDYIKIYNHMKENEYILNFASDDFESDDEGVTLLISEVHKGRAGKNAML